MLRVKGERRDTECERKWPGWKGRKPTSERMPGTCQARDTHLATAWAHAAPVLPRESRAPTAHAARPRSPRWRVGKRQSEIRASCLACFARRPCKRLVNPPPLPSHDFPRHEVISPPMYVLAPSVSRGKFGLRRSNTPRPSEWRDPYLNLVRFQSHDTQVSHRQ